MGSATARHDPRSALTGCHSVRAVRALLLLDLTAADLATVAAESLLAQLDRTAAESERARHRHADARTAAEEERP